MDGSTAASGNVMSLLSSDYKNLTDISGWGSAPSGSFIRKTYKYILGGLFKNCTKLDQAPELPATTLAQGAYFQMF